MAYKEMDVLLGKVQSALGTKQSSLTSSDFRAIDKGFSVETKIDMSEQNLTSGLFGQDSSIPGAGSVDLKIDVPIVPTGAPGVSNVHDYLCCSGMSYALATNKQTYAHSSAYATDWKDMTFWKYSGDKATASSLLTKINSAMFDWEFNGELGKPAMLNLTGRGILEATPAAASYVSGTLTMPTGMAPPVIKSSTMTIGGDATAKIIKFGIKKGNKLELLKDPAQTYGYSRCDIAGAKSTFTATIYQNVGTLNPFTGLAAGTLGDFQFTFGVAGSRITVKSGSSKAQIIDCKPTDDGGILTWDISGIFIDNSLTLVINDD